MYGSRNKLKLKDCSSVCVSTCTVQETFTVGNILSYNAHYQLCIYSNIYTAEIKGQKIILYNHNDPWFLYMDYTSHM